ncbi:MAG: ATP synthase subunit a [Bacteroidetes bacterium ADurb.Bin037]|mgnify:CR=1 FL=1|nr:MAG: ATP synthase subunit a [Bacteroidetes bacterium ADurb.Bin037]HPW79059.1 F0F1 ATP synthase subunit A [Bacteroidales bacterium]HQB56685.1 F0F1 ATP synthase subunit A [Bacteroidales bacterium]
MTGRRAILLFFLSVLIRGCLVPCAAEVKERPPVNVQEIILGHLKDSYQWHFFDIGEKQVVLPLPVIVRSKERGWHVFLSSRLEDHRGYKGFYMATEGLSEGKIVERNSAGKEVRPFDISITKNVVSLFFSCLLLMILVISLAGWYKKREQKGDSDAVPTGFKGAMEGFIMSIHEGVVKKCVGKDYKRYSPYLLTAFFFIFLNNILGLVPIFPAGANLTGNIAITMGLALFTMGAINIFGNKAYWKEILWPDVPLFMKAPVPIMQIIEFFGIVTKPMALMIRLFANIFAGHIIILALTSLVFLTVAMGPAINASMSAASVLFSVFMMVLELLVAYIQAYVFTMLSAIFIGLSRKEDHKDAPVSLNVKPENVQ